MNLIGYFFVQVKIAKRTINLVFEKESNLAWTAFLNQREVYGVSFSRVSNGPAFPTSFVA